MFDSWHFRSDDLYSTDAHELTPPQSAVQSLTVWPDGKYSVSISFRPTQPVWSFGVLVNVAAGLTLASFTMNVMDEDVESVLPALLVLKQSVESSHLLVDAV